MTDIAQLDWEDLKIAASLAHTGTYSGAAAELGIDATTVARRIARLERAFSEPLFHAIDGRRRPTARGAEILAHVDAMAAHAEAIRAMPAKQEGISGHVRVTATAGICDRILAPHAVALLTAHPGLSLSILASDANVNFSRYEADLAIRMARPQRGGFAIRKLAAIPIMLFEADRPDRDAIVCGYPGNLDETPEMVALDRFGLKKKERFISNSATAIRTVLASGAATAVMPVFGEDLDFLSKLHKTPLEARREAWLLTQPHLKRDAATRLVADWIVDCFARAVSS